MTFLACLLASFLTYHAATCLRLSVALHCLSEPRWTKAGLATKTIGIELSTSLRTLMQHVRWKHTRNTKACTLWCILWHVKSEMLCLHLAESTWPPWPPPPALLRWLDLLVVQLAMTSFDFNKLQPPSTPFTSLDWTPILHEHILSSLSWSLDNNTFQNVQVSVKHVSNMCQTCCINSARCLKLLRFAISQHKAFTLVRSPLTRRKRGFSLLTCCTARPRGHKCLQTESSADTTPITTWNFEFCIVLNMWTYVKYEHIWNKGIVKAVLSRQLSIAFSCKCMQMHQCLLAKSRKLVQMIL